MSVFCPKKNRMSNTHIADFMMVTVYVYGLLTINKNSD